MSRAFLEHHVKVGCIGEPRSLPNRLNRNVGIPQHILGLTNANVLEILSKGYASNLLEASAQMRWADVKGLRQMIEAMGLVVMLGYVINDL